MSASVPSCPSRILEGYGCAGHRRSPGVGDGEELGPMAHEGRLRELSLVSSVG